MDDMEDSILLENWQAERPLSHALFQHPLLFGNTLLDVTTGT